MPCSSVQSRTPAAACGKITDNEAARIALLNNAAFLELMADLGIAEADLVQANQLPNPNFSVFFPWGPKQLEFAARFPVEALWLRPHRTAVAKNNTAAIAKRLEQDALNLVRDVKLACVELRLAERRVELARQEAVLLSRFSRLARKRLEAGDISKLEASTAETDALRASIDRDRAPLAVNIAKETLRNLLGLSNCEANFSLAKANLTASVCESEDELLQRAFANRPDLRAAEIAIETEAKRFKLAQKEIFQLTTIFDANGSGSNFEAGPGIDMVLPVFNQNQGAKALADARFQKAGRNYITVRDRIALEVRQALIRYQQAEHDLSRIRNELLPKMDKQIKETELAWEGGVVPYLFVVDSIRRVQVTKVKEADILAESQRAAAELERALGCSIILEEKSL